jgi:hypothetical protein
MQSTAMETAMSFDPKRIRIADRRNIFGFFAALVAAGPASATVSRRGREELGARLRLTEKDAHPIGQAARERDAWKGFAESLRGCAVRRWVLWDTLLAALSFRRYDARDRELLRCCAAAMDVSWETVQEFEGRIADWRSHTSDEDAIIALCGARHGTPVPGARSRGGASPRSASPTVGPTLSTCFLGRHAAGAVSTGVATLGSRQHAKDRGRRNPPLILPVDEPVGRDIPGPDEFRLEHLGGSGMLNIVGVSGFLSARSNYRNHWGCLLTQAPRARCHALRWESQSLIDLGKVFAAPNFASRLNGLADAVEARGVSAGTLSGMPWVLLEWCWNAFRVWRKAAKASDRTGAALARELRNGGFGSRPVTLVGFSLGARVIFRALEDLAATGDCGVVHDVVLMGGAFNEDADRWRFARRAVAGRVVNAFSTRDLVLWALFRIAEFESDAAGIGPICVEGVENVDVTHLARGHLNYRNVMPVLLQRIGGGTPGGW